MIIAPTRRQVAVVRFIRSHRFEPYKDCKERFQTVSNFNNTAGLDSLVKKILFEIKKTLIVLGIKLF